MSVVKPQEDSIWDAPLATIAFFVILLTGAGDLLIDGHLSGDYQKFVDTIAIPFAGVALGRGWAARKPG